MDNYGVDNGARGSSKVSLICLPPTNTAGVSTRIARFSETMNDCFSFVCLCLLCLTSGQKRSLFVQRGLKELNVNWSPFNFAHSKAFSTLLLNWISARLSWGRAFWVVWAQGRKIAREIAKPRFREIQMRIGRNRDGNCKRSTQEMDKLKPNSSCLRSIFEEKSCPFGSMIFTQKTIK